MLETNEVEATQPLTNEEVVEFKKELDYYLSEAEEITDDEYQDEDLELVGAMIELDQKVSDGYNAELDDPTDESDPEYHHPGDYGTRCYVLLSNHRSAVRLSLLTGTQGNVLYHEELDEYMVSLPLCLNIEELRNTYECVKGYRLYKSGFKGFEKLKGWIT